MSIATEVTVKSCVNAHGDVIHITGISSMATRQVLAELTNSFSQRSGHSVAIESVGGVDAAKRVQAGEEFDVVILASDAIDKLIATGVIEPGSRMDLVQIGRAHV